MKKLIVLSIVFLVLTTVFTACRDIDSNSIADSTDTEQTEIEAESEIKDYEVWQTSEDGVYSLVMRQPFPYETVFYLRNNTDEKEKELGLCVMDNIGSIGFVENSYAYIKDRYNIVIIDNDMSNPVPVFTTKDNFPCGENIVADNISRYLFDIYFDVEKAEYIIVYGEIPTDENGSEKRLNDFQLEATYKIGIFDNKCNHIQSWDTNVPVMCYMGYKYVNISKTDAQEFEMTVKFKGEELLKGKFNLETGVYTSIKEFTP